MAQNAGLNGSLLQASFDFLPVEMRRRLRFGGDSGADHAEFRARMQQIDRQFAHLGSRIAAARMREILRPAAAHDANPPVATETSVSAGPSVPEPPSAQELSRQRDALRGISAAIFHFRADRAGEESGLPAHGPQHQRLHPRPLPARYYDILPQPVAAGPLKG